LLANPPVLILDEPTAGLDPSQIRSTRGLIKELGREHTILLSTHILSEVEATCSHVIIIHRGRVAVASPLEDLKSRAGAKAHIRLRLAGTGDPNVFRSVPGVLDLSLNEDPFSGTVAIKITTLEANELTPRLCEFAANNHWRLLDLAVERPTLEDLFVKITEEDAASVQ
jgi:ABC-2 type transport system ATP-binding protein